MKNKPKVSVVRCESYDKKVLSDAIGRCTDMIGGLSKFIKPGSNIVIKPNLLSAALPENAVTTHPVFVETVIEKISEITGSSENITIVDSPGAGIPYTKNNLKKVYEKTGLADISKKAGCKLNYNTEYSSLSFKGGKVIKKFEVINPVLGADIIINLPKFKTHDLTVITGAVKNIFGVVPGFLKPGYHARFNRVEDFSDMLVDLVMLVKPGLTIMDGILGIEGDGPGMSGTPRKIGLILASENPFSVDTVMAKIIGIGEELCPTLAAAKNRGIKGSAIGDIELLGEKLDEVALSNFILPKNAGREELIKNNFARNYILPFIRNSLNPYPYVNKNKCTLCETCVKVCPPKSVFIKNNSIKFDYKKCIRCFCCSEMCPEGAIVLEYSLLGNFILNKLSWAGKGSKS